MNKKEMHDFLKTTSFIPSKKMGQNFLFSNEYQNMIVNSLSEYNNVLEIGPGLGALTDLIIKKNPNNFKLIELDKRIVEFIKNKHPDLEVINNNFLKVDLEKVFDKEYNVISNLPYSISSNAIVNIIKCSKINEAVILIQKEVATRILSKVDEDKYNGFSVLVNSLSEVEYLFDIPNDVFYPKPEVTSTLLKFKIKKDINFNKEEYEKFIRKCFSQKRKTIYNNLKSYFSSEKIIDVLENNGIDKNIRPEKITIEEYQELFRDFYEK